MFHKDFKRNPVQEKLCFACITRLKSCVFNEFKIMVTKMMTEAWGKFAGWKVLGRFLASPNSSIHIKGLSKELKVSPNTAQSYMNLYEKSGMLLSENVANSRQFRLNNDDFLAAEMKRLWMLMQLKEARFAEKMAEKNPSMSTLALFGAFAKGNYTEHSDIDILAISQSKIDDAPVKELEKRLGKQADMTTMAPAKWREMAKSGNKFAVSVSKANILLWGSEL